VQHTQIGANVAIVPAPSTAAARRQICGAGYSLVVSIDAPDVEVDIWTPVAELVGIPVSTIIET
jgi:hypothetical protein